MHSLERDAREVAEPADERDDLAEVLERAARGSQPDARTLFDAVSPIFARVGRTTLGPRDPELADFVQETALRFFRSLHGFRGESRVRWYAFRVATHTAKDWVRGRAALKRSRIRGPIPESARADDDPARTAARRELGRWLVDALPPAQLETFLLRTSLGCSIAEIAEQMNVPIDTVRSRLRRAKRTLRDRIRRAPEFAMLLEVPHDRA